jgi:leucyl/phenylalanyl-tRNA---protein transferase
MRYQQSPSLIRPGDPPSFADPRFTDDEGLVAIGGDLSVPRLLAAYEHGIFPWFNEGLPPLWWSPNPRAVLDAKDLHVSRSLARTLRRGEAGAFQIRANTAFEEVMLACAERDEGTWILPEMLEAYCALHAHGHAHSIEIWDGKELIGGLYGVQRGGLFAAESMFHRRSNMSKVALAVAVRSLSSAGIELFDVQFRTEHLSTMGARELPRDEYLARLESARERAVDLRSFKPSQ